MNCSRPRSSSLAAQQQHAHPSHLHQHWQYQRTPACALLEEPAKLASELRGHESLIGALVHARRVDALADHTCGFAKHGVAIAFADDEAARDNLWLTDERPIVVPD